MDADLSIAASSLDAATTSIAVTSENIANASTPGYVDETAQVQALPGGDYLGIGDGVQVVDISQANDVLLAANNLQAQGALSNLSALQQVATGVEDLFPLASTPSSSSDSSTTDNSIAGQLANFWSAWDTVAASPSSQAPETEVVDMAQGLASSLNEASSQLSQLSSDTVSDLGSQVSQVNSLLTQVASLNQSIVQTEGAGASVNQLQDQLNNVVGQLAQLTGASVQMQSNNTATVSVSGVTLVQADQADSLSVSMSDGTASVTVQPGGVSLPMTSGSIAGLVLGINQYIPQYQSALDGVASALANTVNNQLAQGYTTSGISGASEPLFTGTTAATIAVNPAVAANPSLLAVATTTGAAAVNDGSNAQAMAELGTVSTGPDAAYQNLISGIGTLVQGLNSQVTSQTSVADQVQSALQSVTGVDQNTQLTDLIQYQQVYEASAQLLNIVNSSLQSLLEAV